MIASPVVRSAAGCVRQHLPCRINWARGAAVHVVSVWLGSDPVHVSAGSQSLCPKCGEWTAPGRSPSLCPRAPLPARRCWLQNQGRLQSGRSHAPGTPQAKILAAVRRPQPWQKQRRRQGAAEITTWGRRMLTQRMWVPPRAASPCLPVSLLHDLPITHICILYHVSCRSAKSLWCCLPPQNSNCNRNRICRRSPLVTASLPGEDRRCTDCL